MLNPAHGNPVTALLYGLLLLQPFVQRTLAQGSACTNTTFCAPSAGSTWIPGSIMSIIWNPKMTDPFDEYDKVDLYVVDDANSTRVLSLKKDVDLSTGMTAVRLEPTLFPNDTAIHRSCHIMFIGNGNELGGSQKNLSSSSFYMLRNETAEPSTPIIPVPYPTSSNITNITHTALPTNTPVAADPSSTESNALSPLVIGLISAGCVALMIAIVAIALLFRTQKRSRREASHFKSLEDHPSSPTDDTSKSSIYKGYGEGSFVGPAVGSAIATGRSSTTTSRSAEPMVKGASSILGYNNQSPTSPIASMPLLERNPSTHPGALEPLPVPVPVPVASSTTTTEEPRTTEDLEEGLRAQQGPSALTAGDAQMIAERFRKTMRKPNWEENDVDEEEQDETRRAANQLLREQLNDEGLDMRRGFKRRVTIQDRINRQSVPAPISHMEPVPDS